MKTTKDRNLFCKKGKMNKINTQIDNKTVCTCLDNQMQDYISSNLLDSDWIMDIKKELPPFFLKCPNFRSWNNQKLAKLQ